MASYLSTRNLIFLICKTGIRRYLLCESKMHLQETYQDVKHDKIRYRQHNKMVLSVDSEFEFMKPKMFQMEDVSGEYIINK